MVRDCFRDSGFPKFATGPRRRHGFYGHLGNADIPAARAHLRYYGRPEPAKKALQAPRRSGLRNEFGSEKRYRDSYAASRVD